MEDSLEKYQAKRSLKMFPKKGIQILTLKLFNNKINSFVLVLNKSCFFSLAKVH